MQIFSIDVRLVATCYIRAESQQAAAELLKKVDDIGLDLELNLQNDVPVSGLKYDDPDLPEVSLSPAMTIVGPTEGDTIVLVEDLDEEGEATFPV